MISRQHDSWDMGRAADASPTWCRLIPMVRPSIRRPYTYVIAALSISLLLQVPCPPTIPCCLIMQQSFGKLEFEVREYETSRLCARLPLLLHCHACRLAGQQCNAACPALHLMPQAMHCFAHAFDFALCLDTHEIETSCPEICFLHERRHCMRPILRRCNGQRPTPHRLLRYQLCNGQDPDHAH